MYITVRQKDIKDGMVLSEDVLTSVGTLLVNKGTMVDEHVRLLLEKNYITEIKVLAEEPEDELEMATHLAKLRQTEKFRELSQEYGIIYDNISNHFNQVIKREAQVDKKEIIGDINQMLLKSDSSRDLFDVLNGMKVKKNTMYMHSLNTAIISNIIAKWLKFSQEEIDDITLAGLFHDIGMLMVPTEILEKDPEERTAEETEMYQKHAIYGYRYLMKRELNRQIGLTALTHHERMDGTGYPLQCIGSSLCSYSKIVAIADAYDEESLTDEGKRNPFVLIHKFEIDGLTKFDPEYLMAFLKGIMDTYIGCDVLLSTGEVGTIIYINKDNLSRPMVKIGEEYKNLAVETSVDILNFV